ncbi:hypothetical protein [Streptomyces sp. NPDC048057]|uniref:hypothetical protein n=1 Tax=Streptomyces sp. NPDC048057 TaxID=3155628 RepID=UPI00340AF45E
MSENPPRRFHLQRDNDLTGVSGTGRVADGILWPDGTVTIRWRGERPSTVNWASIDDARTVHGHGGATRIIWDDLAPGAYTLRSRCPHCPDGHTPPDHGQPWHARVGSERDADGQPTVIRVERAAGAHVAESDADWIRDRLNAR